MVQDKQTDRPRPVSLIDYKQYRNAARASPLSGHFVPKTFTEGSDDNDLIPVKEFHKRYIHRQPGNIYTDSGDIEEVPSPTATSPTAISPISAHTPLSPRKSSSTWRRTGTESSLGGSTVREEEEVATSSWFCGLAHKKGEKRKKELEDSGSDECHKEKKLRRSFSWRSWILHSNHYH